MLVEITTMLERIDNARQLIEWATSELTAAKRCLYEEDIEGAANWLEEAERSLASASHHAGEGSGKR